MHLGVGGVPGRFGGVGRSTWPYRPFPDMGEKHENAGHGQGEPETVVPPSQGLSCTLSSQHQAAIPLGEQGPQNVIKHETSQHIVKAESH